MKILLAIIAHGSGTLYYSTQPYCTHNGDSPANTLFEGRLIDAVYERGVSYPMWDRAGGGQAISMLEYINTDGALDSWLDDDWKDVRITLKVVEERAAYSTAVQVGVAVIERIEAPQASRVRHVCRSLFERLEKVITTNYPSTTTNENVWERPKPLTLGRVRWIDSVNSTLNDPGSSTRGFHDVADGPFEGIYELRNRGALATEIQDMLPTGTEYWILQDATNGYGYRYREQEFRHAVDVTGQIRLDSQMLTHSTFPSGTGGNPDGWTVSETGSCTVVWNSAGSVTVTTDGSATASLLQTLTTVSGAWYRIEVDITSGTGVAQIYGDSTVLRSPDTVSGYTLCAHRQATGTSTAWGFRISSGASATYTISAIRVYRFYRIDCLTEFVRFAAVTRGSLSIGDIDVAAFEAIDAAAGYTIAFHNQGAEVRGIDLVNAAAASYGVAIFQNANGQLAPVMIDEPAASADYTLNELQILGELTRETDEAPGLSTRMNYGRNYAPHSSDDLVLLPPTTLANITLRAELQREKRTVTTAATLHGIYSEATEREPLESLASDDTNAQGEIDRICGLYTVPRAFYTAAPFVEDEAPYEIQPGQTGEITHTRYGLSGGVNLLTVGGRSDFLGNAVDLVLWG